MADRESPTVRCEGSQSQHVVPRRLTSQSSLKPTPSRRLRLCRSGPERRDRCSTGTGSTPPTVTRTGKRTTPSRSRPARPSGRGDGQKLRVLDVVPGGLVELTALARVL